VSEIEVSHKIRVCDLAACEGEAVGTCESCGADWCRAHGAVFKGALMRPVAKAAKPQEGKATPKQDEGVDWRQIETIYIQFCWAHMNVWKLALRTRAPAEAAGAPTEPA